MAFHIICRMNAFQSVAEYECGHCDNLTYAKQDNKLIFNRVISSTQVKPTIRLRFKFLFLTYLDLYKSGNKDNLNLLQSN